MFGKQILALGKLWLLLLLMSNGAVANTSVPESTSEKKTETFLKTGQTLHKDGLQPEVLSVRVLLEHPAKSISFGYAVVNDYPSSNLVCIYAGPTVLLVQDTNRCESVSRFLFPYHFFW